MDDSTLPSLKPGKLLDVREFADPAIVGSVFIPESQLPTRVYELPPRSHVFQIAQTGPGAERVRDWLAENGRAADLTDQFEYGVRSPHRLWMPNAFLEKCSRGVPIGSALDLGCGCGREAVFLASYGFEVTAIDHLEDALQLGQRLAAHYLDPSTTVEWICQDLDQPVLEGTFGLVTSFFYLSRPLLKNIKGLLADGGHLVMETFTTEHRAAFGKPKHEDRVLQPGELLKFATGLTVLSYEEGWHEGRHTARLWARA